MRSKRCNTLAWGALAALGLLLLVGSWRRLGKVERSRSEPTGATVLSSTPSPADVVPSGDALAAAAEPESLGRASTSTGEPPEGHIALEVRVYDEREVPIPGARIHAFDGATPLVRSTDENGRCRLFVRDTAGALRVRAEAAGRVHSSYEFEREGPVEFQLWPAVHVRGRVLAGGDAPVVGARLRYEHLACEGCGPEEIVSGPDGLFELLELPALEPAVLAVEAEGHVPIERQEFLLPRTEDVLEQDIHLQRGMAVRGRVLDWSTRAGVPGARVGGLVTDAEGVFGGHLAALPGTTVARVGVSAEEYAARTDSVDLARGELEIRLPRLVTLEGEVTDEDGVPLAGASVYVRNHGPLRNADGTMVESSPLYEPPPGTWYEGLDSQGATDAEGRFRFQSLPWSLNVELEAACRGYTSSERFLARLGEPGATQRVNFALSRAPSDGTWLEGHVLLNGAQTSASGVVAWKGPTQNGTAPFQGQYELAVEPGPIELRFRLDAVPRLRAGDVLTTDAEAGKRHYVPALLEVARATITGRVRFESGAPVPRAMVGAFCAELFGASQTTDEHGEFRLDVADLGRPYTLRASFLDQKQALEAVAAGSEVEVVLEDRHRLLVRLLEADTGARLYLRGHVNLHARVPGRLFAPVQAHERVTDLSGWHEVWLAATTVDLLAQPVHGNLAGHGCGLIRDLELVTADGQPPRADFRLRREPPVAIELDPRSEPWPEDQQLLLVEEELRGEIANRPGGLRSFLPGLSESRTVRFESRRAELTGLAPGRYRFLTDAPAIAFDPPEVWIERAAARSVFLRWSRGR
jgi:protocatechuate 3,4-dioxygenase beta subunit